MSYTYTDLDTAYIAGDGSFGIADVVTFSPDSLTDEEWEIVEELSDSEKIIFALAVLNGEDDVVQEYLDEHRGN